MCVQAKDFNLKKLNICLNKLLKKEEIDFCSPIACSFNGEFPVIGKYRKPSEIRTVVVTLDKNLCPVQINNDDFYYGVSPKLNAQLISDAIVNGRFRSELELDCFIKEHCSLFMLYNWQATYLLDFARYVVLAVASKYGIKIKWDDIFSSIIAKYDPFSKILVKQNNILKVCGCPTIEIENAFNNFNLYFEKNRNGIWEITQKQGTTLRDIYTNEKTIGLLDSCGYYSGVLLKPIEFDFNQITYESKYKHSLTIHFDKTTYATVFALDNNFLEHPLLSSVSKKNLSDMLMNDDEEKRRLIFNMRNNGNEIDLAYMERSVECINDYLSSSSNVNQICVGSSILSSDGYIMSAIRNANTIDSQKLYPGVNGNAEIRDSDVSFYAYSCLTDCPTIDLSVIGSSTSAIDRVDFNGEINREADAELIERASETDWECCGIVVLGNEPSKKTTENGLYTESRRRLHFTIVFDYKSKHSFDEVVHNSHIAIESYENNAFWGVKPCYHKDYLDAIGSCILGVSRLVVKYRDVFEAALFLFLIRSLNFTGKVWMDLSVKTCILLLSASGLIKNIVKWSRRNPKNNRFFIYTYFPYETFEQRLKCFLQKHLYQYYPISLVCFILSTERHIVKIINKEDNN